MGGDSNLYGYVLGDPVNFVDPWGLLPFDEDGQEVLENYVNKALNGSSLWYVPAFFAALWTPDTSEKTLAVLTVGKVGFVCKSYLNTNYHSPHNYMGPHIHWGPRRNMSPKAPRKWHFGPKNPNFGKPKGKSDWNWIDWWKGGKPWEWK